MSSALKDALRDLLNQFRGEFISTRGMVIPAPSQTTGVPNIEYDIVIMYREVIWGHVFESS
jgi:hypothetical protein